MTAARVMAAGNSVVGTLCGLEHQRGHRHPHCSAAAEANAAAFALYVRFTRRLGGLTPSGSGKGRGWTGVDWTIELVVWP